MAEGKEKFEEKFMSDPKYEGARNAISSVVNATLDKRIEEAKQKKKGKPSEDSSENFFDSIFGGFGKSEED